MQDACSFRSTFDEPTVLRCIAMLESIGRKTESVEGFKQYLFLKEREDPTFHATLYPKLRQLEKACDESIDVFSLWMAEYSRLDAVALALESWRRMCVDFTKVSAGDDLWAKLLIKNTKHHFSIGLLRVQHHLFDAGYLEVTQGLTIDEKMTHCFIMLQMEQSIADSSSALDCLSN